MPSADLTVTLSCAEATVRFTGGDAAPAANACEFASAINHALRLPLREIIPSERSSSGGMPVTKKTLHRLESIPLIL